MARFWRIPPNAKACLSPIALFFLEAGIVGRYADTIGEHFKPILATNLIDPSLLFINSGQLVSKARLRIAERCAGVPTA